MHEICVRWQLAETAKRTDCAKRDGHGCELAGAPATICIGHFMRVKKPFENGCAAFDGFSSMLSGADPGRFQLQVAMTSGVCSRPVPPGFRPPARSRRNKPKSPSRGISSVKPLALTSSDA